MQLDSDYVLFGTGVAPLIAAAHLISREKSVLVLNPDWDFFKEDSELPLDPFWPLSDRPVLKECIQRSQPDFVLGQLRPHFPGAVEFWQGSQSEQKLGGYRDQLAPHVRARNRLWIQPESGWIRKPKGLEWSVVEELFVEAADQGLKPEELGGLSAGRRFPGFRKKGQESELHGLLIPKLCDVDIVRYRNGLLEFLQERPESARIVTEASQVERVSGGVRFYAPGGSRSAKVKNGVIVFWTPRMHFWVQSQLDQLKQNSGDVIAPSGIRLWEEWSFGAPSALDVSTVGVFENMSVWMDMEGPNRTEFDQNESRLKVLMGGADLMPFQPPVSSLPADWISEESLRSLSRLFNDFLHWDKVAVHSVKPRALFEWPRRGWWKLDRGSEDMSNTDKKDKMGKVNKTDKTDTWVISGADGWLVSVVQVVLQALGSLK